jgi:hypothetical protein
VADEAAGSVKDTIKELAQGAADMVTVNVKEAVRKIEQGQ